MVKIQAETSMKKRGGVAITQNLKNRGEGAEHWTQSGRREDRSVWAIQLRQNARKQSSNGMGDLTMAPAVTSDPYNVRRICSLDTCG